MHSCVACPGVWQQTRGQDSSATPGTTQLRRAWTHTKCLSVSPLPTPPCPMRRRSACATPQQRAKDDRWLVTYESGSPLDASWWWRKPRSGFIIIQFRSSYVENPAAVWALYRPAWGTRNLWWFKRHKGIGPEIQPSSPWHGELSIAFFCPSQPVFFSSFFLPPLFPHLLHRQPDGLSAFWIPCVTFLTTIFLLELRIGGSVTNPNPFFSPLSSHLVLICIFTPTVDSKGSLTGNVANYSLLKEDTWGILRCFIITSDLITPL